MSSRATSAGHSVRPRLVALPRRSVIVLIELYRTWVSPMRLPTCRFEPTCSAYAVEALEQRGLMAGGVLAIVRLLKCGPWHKPGYDPVPASGLWHRRHTSTGGAHTPPEADVIGTSQHLADDCVGVSTEVRDS